MTDTRPLLTLFDIDGTLVHSAGTGRGAIQRAMEEVYGTAGPIDELPFDGLTDPTIVRTLLNAAGLPDAEVDAGLETLWGTYTTYLEHEIDLRRSEMRAETGVPALLDVLEGTGATLGLVTGNIVGGAERKLTACALWERFEFGAYGSDAADRNELPPIALSRGSERTGRAFAIDRTWIIGDTPQDIACAHASGMRVLAVATGRFSVSDLEAHGADRVVPDLGDTPHIMSLLEEPAPGRASAPHA